MDVDLQPPETLEAANAIVAEAGGTRVFLQARWALVLCSIIRRAEIELSSGELSALQNVERTLNER